MTESEPTGTKRVFIAIDIDLDLRRKLGQIQKDFNPKENRIRWVAPEGMHLTLAFLGDQEPERVECVKNILDQACAGIAPFDFGLEGLGYFGREHSPRVIWVGVKEASGTLEQLWSTLKQRLKDEGFEVEERAFHPHVTLGRIKSSRRPDALTSTVASATSARYGEIRVAQVHLYRSQLSREGATYFIEHSVTLKEN